MPCLKNWKCLRENNYFGGLRLYVRYSHFFWATRLHGLAGTGLTAIHFHGCLNWVDSPHHVFLLMCVTLVYIVRFENIMIKLATSQTSRELAFPVLQFCMKFSSLNMLTPNYFWVQMLNMIFWPHCNLTCSRWLKIVMPFGSIWTEGIGFLGPKSISLNQTNSLLLKHQTCWFKNTPISFQAKY